MTPLEQLLYAWIASAVLMGLLWCVQLKTSDAGIVDAVWALSVGAISIFFAFNGEGYAQRRILLAILAGAWALRLGAYLLYRNFSLPEDGRYKRLRKKWGARFQLKMFVFFQVQASWCVLFALPMWMAAGNPVKPLGLFDLLAALTWLVSVCGNTIADWQLARFRATPGTSGTVCRRGLWSYCRHPNYFFEWLHWWVYVLLCTGSSMQWWSLGAPLIMFIFLTRITGIPPTEANAIASRGEAYREYQRTTNAFFPWSPSREDS
jgi:steroid 5-alpha reductase family enzyme